MIKSLTYGKTWLTFDNNIVVSIQLCDEKAHLEITGSGIDTWFTKDISNSDALVDYLYELSHKGDIKTCSECGRKLTDKPLPHLCGTCYDLCHPPN